jgi:hypothetical protein
MFGNLGRMMKLASEMKTRLPEMQAKLEAARYASDSGGGTVKATVNGKLALVELKIDGKLLAGGADAEMLEDLIKAAIVSAQRAAAEGAKQMMRELTGGMELPGIEGMI